MNIFIVIFLLVGGLITAVFSAVFGVAGGMMLFTLLTLFLDAKTAIPIHAIIQSVSNVSRVVSLYSSVSKKLVGRFIILILPGVYLGSLVFTYLNPVLLEVGIGFAILIMVNLPSKFSFKELPDNAFVGLGFISGFLGMIVGVTGPLLSPFFMMKNLTKEQQVANKAACQFIVHLIKIPAFFQFIKFDFEPYYFLLAGLTIVTIAGALIGRNLIARISDANYKKTEKWVLNVLATIIIVKGLSELVYNISFPQHESVLHFVNLLIIT